MSAINFPIGGREPIDPRIRVDTDAVDARAAEPIDVALEPSTFREVRAQAHTAVSVAPTQSGREAMQAMFDSMERSVDLMARYEEAAPEEKERLLKNFKKEMGAFQESLAPSGGKATLDLQRGLERRQGIAWAQQVVGTPGDPTFGWSEGIGAEEPIAFLLDFAQQDLSEFTFTNSSSIEHLNSDLEGVTAVFNALSLVNGIAGVASWVVQGNMIKNLEATLERMKDACPGIEKQGITGVDSLINREMSVSGNFNDLSRNLEKHGIYVREINHILGEKGLPLIDSMHIENLTKKETLEIIKERYISNYKSKILDLHSKIQVQKEIYSNIGIDSFTTVGRKLLALRPVIGIFTNVLNSTGASAFALGLGNVIALGAAIHEFQEVSETQERMKSFASSAYSAHFTRSESGKVDFSEYKEEVIKKKIKGVIQFVRQRNSWYRLSPKIDVDRVKQQLSLVGIDFEKLNKEFGPIKRYVDFETRGGREGLRAQILIGESGKGIENPVQAMIDKSKKAQELMESRLKIPFNKVYESFISTNRDLSPEDFQSAFIEKIHDEFKVRLDLNEVKVLLQHKGISISTLDAATLNDPEVKGFLLTYAARSKHAMSVTLKNTMKMMRIDKVKMEKEVSIWHKIKAGLQIGSATIGIVLGIALVVLAIVGVATAGIMTGGAILLAVAAIGIMAVGIYKSRKSRPQTFASLLSIEAIKYRFKQFQVSRKTYRKLQGDLAENRRVSKETSYQISAKNTFLEQRISILNKGEASVPESIWRAAVEGMDARFPGVLKPTLEKGAIRTDLNVIVNEIALDLARNQIHESLYREQVKHLKYIRTGYSLDLGLGGLGSKYRNIDEEITSVLGKVQIEADEKKLDKKAVIKGIATRLAGECLMHPPLSSYLDKILKSTDSVDLIKKRLSALLNKEGFNLNKTVLNQLFEGVSESKDILSEDFQYRLLENLSPHMLAKMLQLVEPAIMKSTRPKDINSYEIRGILMSGYSQILLDTVQDRQKRVSGYGDKIQFVARFKRKQEERSWADCMFKLGYSRETQKERTHAIAESKVFQKLILGLKNEFPNEIILENKQVISFLKERGINNPQRFFEKWNTAIKELSLSASSNFGEAATSRVYEGFGETQLRLGLSELIQFKDIEDTSIIFDAFAKCLNSEALVSKKEDVIKKEIETTDKVYRSAVEIFSRDKDLNKMITAMQISGIKTKEIEKELSSRGILMTAKFSSLDESVRLHIKNQLWESTFLTGKTPEAKEALRSTLIKIRRLPAGKRMLSSIELSDNEEFKRALVREYAFILDASENLEQIPKALLEAAESGSLDQDTIDFVKEQINIDLSSSHVSLSEVQAKFKYFFAMEFDSFTSYLRTFTANQTFATLKA